MTATAPIKSSHTGSTSGKISAAELTELRKEMIQNFNEFERSFYREHPFVWWGTLLGPIILTFTILGAIYVEAGAKFAIKLITTTLAAFFLFGRFIILGGNDPDSADIHRFLTSGQLFLLMTYLDLLVATILSFHIGFLFKIPILGQRASELVADGRVILVQHPWMRRMTFVGLIGFVLFPLAATGSVGGSIFGRLLGMSRWATFSGIAMGSIVGNGIMYLGSDVIGRYLDKDNPWLFWGGVGVIVILILLLERRYRVMKNAVLVDDTETA